MYMYQFGDIRKLILQQLTPNYRKHIYFVLRAGIQCISNELQLELNIYYTNLHSNFTYRKIQQITTREYAWRWRSVGGNQDGLHAISNMTSRKMINIVFQKQN